MRAEGLSSLIAGLCSQNEDVIHAIDKGKCPYFLHRFYQNVHDSFKTAGPKDESMIECRR